MPTRISRAAYADMYGPTTGDRVRLADTELFVEVERDLTTYGEEVKFGGGKVIRDGMGQSQAAARRGRRRHRHHQRADPRLDRHLQGRRRPAATAASPRSARPATPTPSPASTIVIGPGTEIIAGEGKILTAGGFDAHIHFICPQQIDDALHSGVTTLLGGGTGPAHGTLATTCTPGPWHIAPHAPGGRRRAGQHRHLRQGQRLAARPRSRRWSAPAPARSSCTRTGARRPPPSTAACRVADAMDVQVMIHTDTLNELRLRRGHHPRHRRAAPSTPSTPRAPAAATRPTSSRSAACRTSSRPRPTRPGPTPSTRSRSTSTC